MQSRNAVDRSVFDLNLLPRPLLVMGLLAACLLSGSLGMAARRPFILAADTRASNEKLARQYMMLKYETQRLERQAAEMKTPQGMERKAREKGYVKPNETRITFLPGR